MGITNRSIRQKGECFVCFVSFLLNVNIFKSTIVGRFNSFMPYNIHVDV